MKKLLLVSILFKLKVMCIYQEPPHPADISYLVADFKYSQEHGVKICEIQDGAFSALEGDRFLAGEEGNISPLIADFFALFPLKKWAAELIYPPLKRAFAAKEWNLKPSLKELLKDPIFLENAALGPVNPFFISSYKGMVYAPFDLARNFNFYCKAYPGILFINAATLPYWRDKYKMNMLFNLNSELKHYKAEWRLYPKKYDPLLSKKIQEELPSELYVIKPRREARGNGVIVIAKGDLESVLHMILTPLASLETHSDKKYSYWWKNKDDTFLIEKYYQSDDVYCSLPLSEETSSTQEYPYDATMRLAFILQYDGGKMTYHCLGGFWKLPSKNLDEDGSLNETRISCCKPPFYKAIDPELLKEVNIHMGKAMLLLYEIMLNEKAK